jgi:hypothetical protein
MTTAILLNTALLAVCIGALWLGGRIYRDDS